jgi:hypothetical protein
VISLRAVEKWIAAFDGGRIQCVDLPSFGRPGHTGKLDTVRALTEGKGDLAQKKIAQMLGSNCETVEHILCDDLNKRKANFESVLHVMNISPKAVRA